MVRFLIIRFSSIGDIVLTTPVIRAIKTQVENSEVHFLTKAAYSEILISNPYLTKVHLLSDRTAETVENLRKEEFDYIIDLQNNFRSRNIKQSLKRMYFTLNKVNIKKWIFVNLKIDLLPELHVVDRYLQTLSLFDVTNDQKGLDFFLEESDLVSAEELPDIFRTGFVAMAIGAQHNTKKLPINRIIEIAEKIEPPIVLVGGPGDRENGEIIRTSLPAKNIVNGCGKWTINQSASIIRQSKCVITHDTGMMHIAAAFRKKIIAVWGNTTPRFGMYPYFADPESVNFEVNGLKCRPCSKLGKTRCPKKHFRCMNDHDPIAIAAAANKLFQVR